MTDAELADAPPTEPNAAVAVTERMRTLRPVTVAMIQATAR